MVKEIKFKNQIFSKKELKTAVYDAFTNYGIIRSSILSDEMKELGFNYATTAGISISIEDLKIPPTKKKLLIESNKEIEKSDLTYARGEINSVERFQKIIDTWNKTSEILKNNLVDYFRETDPLNSIYLMAFSGARGNLSQVRQLVGMRGLMSDPNGQIIDIPIIHNFREGLTLTDYIMSAYGARKGVVDTALKTADSGYLTRRLIDVAQDIIIRENDCLTKRSIRLHKKNESSTFISKLIGRTSAETVRIKGLKNPIVKDKQQITQLIADKIKRHSISSIKLYSPLTCQSARSICQKCYGWNLATCRIVKLGEAIGIIAAQSIGEPGTQLTMRTFHTGGIFTADPSRQIRSKHTGFFSFSGDTQYKNGRTLYGSKILLLEREAKFRITNYKNERTQITLPADSSIFIKNKSFIKSGELIAELPLKNQQTVRRQKNIIAPHSGQCLLFKEENIAWIMENEVYSIPPNSLFNNFKSGQEITKKDSLLNFKLISKKEGIVRIKNNSIQDKIETIEIEKCKKFFNLNVFWEKKIEKLIVKTKENQYYMISNDISQISTKNLTVFAKKITSKYKTETGGQIFYPNNLAIKTNKFFEKNYFQKNRKILFIPLESHTINKDRSLLLISNLTKLKAAKTELIRGLYSETAGFLQTRESNQIINEIKIKPGEFFEFFDLKLEEINELKKLNKKIYFPGEVIFDDIIVEYLTFIEIIEDGSKYGIILRPIEEFNIPKPKNTLKLKQKEKEKIHFRFVNSLLRRTKRLKQQSDLIEFNVLLEQKLQFNPNKNNFLFKLIKKNNTKAFNLALVDQESISINEFISKKFNNENLKISLFVKNFEYIEFKTLLALISIIPTKKLNLETIDKIYTEPNSPKFLLTSKENYKNYYNEGNLKFKNSNVLVKKGDKIEPRIKINYSGKIIFSDTFKFKIHKGTPFYITNETELINFKDNSRFVKEGDVFGRIEFEQIVTGDIVQGLPKIEEILEARKAQNPAVLASSAGLVKEIINGETKKIEILDNTKPKKYREGRRSTLYNFKNRNEITVKKSEYVYLGQALTQGSINPHNLLTVYFNYYKNYGNDYEAAYMSFKNIQLLLIQKVQQVYNSQGVSIADKHLEVIIKRISSKVQVISYGTSYLLPGEIIELKKINYINKILFKSGKRLIQYSPILLGITKASLLTDSFISAASFQETTKILTSAAIEGKIDWLRGLKENVIIGRLIPAGTGFRDDVITR